MTPIPGGETPAYSMDAWDPDSVESDGYMGSRSDLDDDPSDSEPDLQRIYLEGSVFAILFTCSGAFGSCKLQAVGAAKAYDSSNGNRQLQ